MSGDLVIIIGQVNIKNRLVSFDNQTFDFLGKISFGIYVYHPFLIFVLSTILIKFNIADIYKYPIVYISILGTTILISYLSFEFFEKKFIKLKNRFAVIKSSGYRK